MEGNLKLLKKHLLYLEDEDCDDTFLIRAHADLVWDKEAFNLLVVLMYRYCVENESKEFVERWVADGFWDIPRRVEDWHNRSNYFNNISDEYYQKAYILLQDLALYFFTGMHPRIDKQDLIRIFFEETK